jgi:hypothetical protein
MPTNPGGVQWIGATLPPQELRKVPGGDRGAIGLVAMSSGNATVVTAREADTVDRLMSEDHPSLPPHACG